MRRATVTREVVVIGLVELMLDEEGTGGGGGGGGGGRRAEGGGIDSIEDEEVASG